MKIAKSLWETVRLRAYCVCEFCGVDETGAGAQLTVDHYQPKSKGGLNVLENLIYCCFACNYLKNNYFPLLPTDLPLWNPRQNDWSSHFLLLGNGYLQALSPVGEVTIRQLQLNRPQLVMLRLEKKKHEQRQAFLEKIEAYAGTEKEMTKQLFSLYLEEKEASQTNFEIFKRLFLDK